MQLGSDLQETAEKLNVLDSHADENNEESFSDIASPSYSHVSSPGLVLSVDESIGSRKETRSESSGSRDSSSREGSGGSRGDSNSRCDMHI